MVGVVGLLDQGESLLTQPLLDLNQLGKLLDSMAIQFVLVLACENKTFNLIYIRLLVDILEKVQCEG